MTYEELSIKLADAENALVVYQNVVAIKATKMAGRRRYVASTINRDEIRDVSTIVKRMSNISNSLLPAGDICKACNGTGKANRHRRR
jgi:hypothetical protein